jgi:hypothetical protein
VAQAGPVTRTRLSNGPSSFEGVDEVEVGLEELECLLILDLIRPRFAAFALLEETRFFFGADPHTLELEKLQESGEGNHAFLV